MPSVDPRAEARTALDGAWASIRGYEDCLLAEMDRAERLKRLEGVADADMAARLPALRTRGES